MELYTQFKMYLFNDLYTHTDIPPSYLFIPNMHVKGGDLFFNERKKAHTQKERKQKIKKKYEKQIYLCCLMHDSTQILYIVYMNMYDCNTIDTNYGDRERKREKRYKGEK